MRSDRFWATSQLMHLPHEHRMAAIKLIREGSDPMVVLEEILAVLEEESQERVRVEEDRDTLLKDIAIAVSVAFGVPALGALYWLFFHGPLAGS